MVIDAGISYSNIQQFSKIPCIFVGVLVRYEEDNKIPILFDPKIESDSSLLEILSLKKFRQHEKYEQQIIEIKRKIIEDKIIKAERFTQIFSNYYILLNNLISYANNNNIEINTCYLRTPEDKTTKFSVKEASNMFSYWFQDINIEFKTAEDSNGVLDLARSYSNYYYYKQKRENPFYLNNLLSKNCEQASQVVRFRYRNAFVEEYGEYFLGFPELIFRNNYKLRIKPIKLEEHFDFFIAGKYCVGPTTGADETPLGCVNQNIKHPFGSKLKNNWETCFKCKKTGSTYDSIFLEQDEENTKKDFYTFILFADYAIYASLFKNTVKIGRSLLSRVISRLVEQTASDALIFYPINSLKTASYIEDKLAELLQSKISESKITKDIDVDLKYSHVKEIISTEKHEPSYAYDEVYDIIQDKLDDPWVNSLLNKNILRMNFVNNWIPPIIFPEKVDKLEDFTYIKGKIQGIVGQLIFIDDKVYDFSNIQGMVGILNE